MKTISFELESLVKKAFPNSGIKARDLDITYAHNGWDGLGTKSLEETGKLFHLTRERVRQISSKTVRKLKNNSGNHFFILSNLIDRIEQLVPARADCLEALLRAEGLDIKQIEGVIKAGQLFLGRAHHLKCISEHGGRFILIEGMENHVARINSQAQKQCSHVGVVHTPDLAGLVPELVTEKAVIFINQVLGARSDSHTVDDKGHWIWLADAPRNRLTNCMYKMLSAFSSTTIDEIRIGVNRHFSKIKKNTTRVDMPDTVLARLINAWGLGACSEAGIVRRGPLFKTPAKLLELEMAIIAFINASPTKIAREKELENALVPVINDETHPKKYNFSIALNFSTLLCKGPRRGEYVMTGVI